jgi:hypothetical protein
MNKGDRFQTNSCGWLVVDQYVSPREVYVRFLDTRKTKVIAQARDIRSGLVKNPNYPSVFGVGYFGQGEYSSKAHPLIYHVWYNMLRRCYHYCAQNKDLSYVGCTVCRQWQCFQNFCEWYLSQKHHDQEGMDIDKDILKRGNKVYSPKYCSLVPYEINVLFTKSNRTRGEFLIGVSRRKNGKFVTHCNVEGKGKYLGQFNTELEAHRAYKEAKEAEIKRVAREWKIYLDREVYLALLKYKVGKND